MKYLITVAALLACSPALAAPTALHSCDLATWETKEVAVQCAQRAGDAAALAVVKFHREVARAYRADPIGARIAAATSVRSMKPNAKPKPTIAAAAAKSVQAGESTRLAVAFNPKFMESLKEKR